MKLFIIIIILFIANLIVSAEIIFNKEIQGTYISKEADLYITIKEESIIFNFIDVKDNPICEIKDFDEIKGGLECNIVNNYETTKVKIIFMIVLPEKTHYAILLFDSENNKLVTTLYQISTENLGLDKK